MTPDVFTLDILRDYLLVGAGIFTLGMLGFLSRRNLIVMFLSAEMMLQGTALSLIAFGRYHGNWTGQILTILILTVAACEASIALALIVILYNRRSSLDVTLWQDIRDPLAQATSPAVVAEEAEPFDAIPGPETYPHLSPRESSQNTLFNHGSNADHEHPRTRARPAVPVTSAHNEHSPIVSPRSGPVSDFFISQAWLIPFLPLLGAVLASIAPKHLRAQAHLPVAIGIGLAFLFSLGTLFSAGPEATTLSFQWINVSDLDIPIELRVDGLSAIMLSMVTFVSTIVAVFAAGYMVGDPSYPRFFALIGLFVFSMTGLVLSNNYVLTYAFWEGVGACSYLLIGFWHSRPSAAAAALKAFLVNRIGDFGFAVAIFWMWTACNHDLRYDNILSPATIASLPQGTIVGISLLLFWAATAKSAQIPLYTWLPDAMEGPTPVSALIHAATMVTAGVYLIARSLPLLSHAEGVMALISVIGCATAVLSAAIALTQTDLKRVLAYSTVSQLGYMFMALGAGVGNVAQLAVTAAMFHLFTHAFFKALLFLAAGSVMHAMGDVIDMRRFSGLRQRLPYTCLTFAVGGLALAGIFPLSGFFSKDEILSAISAASHASHSLGWIYGLIYWLAVVTAGLTAFYTGRAFFMTFWGEEKLPSPQDPEAIGEPGHAEAPHDHSSTASHSSHHEIGHESSLIMTIPLAILAACTLLIGVICLFAGLFSGGTTAWFTASLHHTFDWELLGHEEHSFSWFTAFIGTVASVGGLGLSYLFYAQPRSLPTQLAERFQPLYQASLHKFKVDELYQTIFVGPYQIVAQICEFLDTQLIDRLVMAIAHLPGRFARETLAPYQNGLIQFYAAISAVGIVGLLLILLLF